MNKITCDEAVRMLKLLGHSSTAATLARHLATSSRAVATALRGPVKDGRVTISWRKGRDVAFYRFVRLKPK